MLPVLLNGPLARLRDVHVQSLQLVERLTRIDADTPEYEFTVTDPETWTCPWTASIPMRRTDAPLYE